MICDACQHEIHVGDWPWCPHPHGYNVSVIDDQLEGGPRFFDTMGHEDVWIESKSQWRREVAARDLVNVDKHDSAYYAKLRRMHDEKLRDES